MLPNPKPVVVTPVYGGYGTAGTKTAIDREEVINILKDLEGIKRRLQRVLKQS